MSETTLLNKNKTKISIDEVNNVNVLTDRIKMRKQEYLNAKRYLCSERSHLVTESWKETEGEPVVLRRAKLFSKVLNGISVSIKKDELIVGSQTKYIRGASPSVDYTSDLVFDTFSTEKLTTMGEVAESFVTDEDKKILLEDASYWKGRAPGEVIKRIVLQTIKEPIQDYIDAHIFNGSPFFSPASGRNLDYSRIIDEGINGILSRLNKEKDNLKLSTLGSWRKYEFLEACTISCHAVINFAGRYAKLARQLAALETDPIRKKELETIATHCEWVPANPARTFHEALQSMWFIHLALNLETASQGENVGRMDQFLYPLYEKDIFDGKITRQEAAELLGCIWIKLSEMEGVKSVTAKKTGQASQFQDVTIGGLTKDGRDATNELTFLILEVTRQIKLPQPPVYLRYHRDINPDLLIKAVETNRDNGAGNPAFLNDHVTLLKLTDRGVPITDARNWIAGGCIAIHVPNASTGGDSMMYNKVKAFELALYDGIEPKSGKRLGPATGDPRNFTTFEQLYDAFLKQLEYEVDLIIRMMRVAKQVKSEVYCLPFASMLLDDCIEKGIGYQQGGCRYPWLMSDFADIGHQNISDGLAAIKKYVFEEKKLTMSELLDALKVNFEGKEGIYKMLLSAPKYGNDDDYADELFNRVTLDASRIMAQPDFYGKPMYITRGGATQHYWGGLTVSALPDGKKAWEPTADATLSPVQGMDVNGPTAVFLSATKVNQVEYAMTTLLNMKIMPSMVKTREGINKFIALLRTYFDRGGWHVQFNMIDEAILIDAKEHPEKHKELLVRVAGYSAYFVELSPQVQEEIINRTMHSF